MIGNKKILSVVTARKGSKGIPNKNIRELMGEPLFLWSVYASVLSDYVDKTVISSDCPEIEKIYINKILNWHKYGLPYMCNVAFIKRPKEISGDLSKNEEALIHALNWMNETQNEKYDVVCNLQPTSPVRTGELLSKAIEEYYDGGYDSLITAKKDTPFLWRKKDGKWTYPVDYNDCCDRKMRQSFKDDEFVLHDSGSIYLTNSDILLDRNCRIGYNPCIFEVDKLNSLQIDTEFDFKLIEEMIKAYGLKSLVNYLTHKG